MTSGLLPLWWAFLAYKRLKEEGMEAESENKSSLLTWSVIRTIQATVIRSDSDMKMEELAHASSHKNLHVGVQTTLINHQPVIELPNTPIFGRTKSFYFNKSVTFSLIFCLINQLPSSSIFMSLLVRPDVIAWIVLTAGHVCSLFWWQTSV